MEYQRLRIKPLLTIRKLITLHYFEFAKNYVFSGELHDFWECVYVDKGEVQVTADEESFLLPAGSIVFHQPNEFHSFYAANGTAPNIIVITFECNSRAMRRFVHKRLLLRDEERNLLSEIVKEGMNAFPYPFPYPLERRKKAPPGSEQLFVNYLEAFLIRLLRRMDAQQPQPDKSLSPAAREKDNQNMVQCVLHYLEEHLDQKLTLAEICQALLVAKTRLKERFKQQTGETVMGYFTGMKISRAKTFIREESFNFSEIASKLGFADVHHFSKSFKRTTGMTPSEYARSVKARSGAAERSPD